MKVRTAIRKSVKWGGAVALVMLVAVWAASGWWLYIGAVSASTAICVGLGRVEIYTLERPQHAVLTTSSSGSSRLISINGPSFEWRFERYL